MLWWSPDPRAVLFPAELHVSRSLRKRCATRGFETRLDTDFATVIRECSAPRDAGDGTWLTPRDDRGLHAAARARIRPQRRELAWTGELVGGLYGVWLGRVFFGESMFSRAPTHRRSRLARLVDEAQARGIVLIDCQIASPHLQSLGSRSIPRAEFIGLLAQHCRPHQPGSWAAEPVGCLG